jgi:hypothetical protein
MTTAADVAQTQLDAYNAQDLTTFCAQFSEDVRVADLNGAVTLEGMAAYRAKYEKLFAEFPENRVTLLGRVALGNAVIDHERVRRSKTAEPFEVLAIYTCSGGLITRVDFVKP